MVRSPVGGIRCSVVSFTLSFVLGASAFAQAPTLRGDASCAWGSRECNRCVQDVDRSLRELRNRGDISGFRMNFATGGLGTFKHWQGVQRLPADGGRFLVVSRSGSGVMFVVSHFPSRDDDGRRFRSNRLNPGSFAWLTPPPASDGVVTEIDEEASFDHAGGIQVVGEVLAVPLEGGGRSRVVFWDMADPLDPRRLYHLEHSDPMTSSSPGNAGAVATSRLEDGRYLVIVGGKDSDNLDFYVSSTTSLLDTSTTFERFSFTTNWDNGPFQSMNLVTQCDGRLFLVGNYRSGGKGYVSWYDVRNGAGNSVVLANRRNKHMICGYPAPGFGSINHCNFKAAGGAYVDPDGRLLYYATEHADDGPGGSVKFEEFRSIRPSTCPTIDDAWVELYDDDTFRDRGVIIDHADRFLRNYNNYDQVEDFEDRASSARWCIPPGHRFRMFEHKNSCRGRIRDLVGTGEENNLKDISFGDKLSCSRWLTF